MNMILSLDLGTSSTRARLYAADTGTAIEGAVAKRDHQPKRTPDGGEVLDAEALVQEVVTCIREALAGAPKERCILGVGMSCFWHSAVGVDSEGVAQTPVLLWSDRRSAGQVSRLKQEMPTMPERTGCPWHTSYLPGRLLWLREAEPEVFVRCVRFLSPAEYLFARLFGLERVTVSRCMASASGLLNQAAGTWAFDYPLSAISDAPASGLRGEFAAQLPELAEIPWFPALGDGACSNIGCGAVTPERIALMIGTSGAMRVVTPGLPQLPEGLWRYQIDAERGALGGALSNGGSVWEWLQKTLRLQDDTEAAFAEMHPDGHGLTVLPFLSGERAPLWEDGLTASIHGLTAATTSLDIAQAFREAVAFRFVAVRERLRAVSPSGEIIGTGAGLLASPTWVQVIASALGEPIRLVDEEEASSRGAALWACEQLGLGRIEDAPMPRTITVFSPDVAAHTAYAEAYQRQDTLLVRNLP